jgi:hypothetical protein
MKRLLSVLALGLLTTAATAQVSFESNRIQGAQRSRPNGGNNNSAPPVTNPEPLTMVGLAGAAAVAGGMLRRRKQKQAA